MTRRLHPFSQLGASFVGAFEGFRAEPYNDAAGHATIGYGHLIAYASVDAAIREKWGTITRAQGIELLQRDAHVALAGVREYVRVALTQAQTDALVSFAYNCGPGALAGVVGNAVNSKPRAWLPASRRVAWHRRVTDALMLWDHAGGVVLAGLERRRLAEARLFETGRYTRAAGNPYANA